MACRVGMSTMPHERIGFWCGMEGHTGWEILASDLTYDEALALERREAHRLGCFQEAGGKRIPGRVWAVYHVWGGRVVG